jgi:pyridoxamine 5'-phosphate oxidase
MEKDLGYYRKNYNKNELLKKNIPENPMELFQKWFYEADESNGVEEANIMNLATIGLDNFPKNRIVLLKRFTWEGFIFYTNYNSEKGKAIRENPNVALSFFWHSLERQIIIKGIVEKIAENLSDGYFETRPEGSKLGAWASDQSEVIDSRGKLDKKLDFFENKFKDMEIPRPTYWGGYIVKPTSIEFWQGRPNRMHDRMRYTLQENYDWKLERLEP